MGQSWIPRPCMWSSWDSDRWSRFAVDGLIAVFTIFTIGISVMDVTCSSALEVIAVKCRTTLVRRSRGSESMWLSGLPSFMHHRSVWPAGGVSDDGPHQWLCSRLRSTIQRIMCSIPCGAKGCMFYRSWPRLGVTTSWSGWSATGTGATSNLWTIEGVAVSWQLGGRTHFICGL